MVSSGLVDMDWWARVVCLAASSVSRISIRSPAKRPLYDACTTAGQRVGSRVSTVARLSDDSDGRAVGNAAWSDARLASGVLDEAKASSIGLRASCRSAT